MLNNTTGTSQNEKYIQSGLYNRIKEHIKIFNFFKSIFRALCSFQYICSLFGNFSISKVKKLYTLKFNQTRFVTALYNYSVSFAIWLDLIFCLNS